MVPRPEPEAQGGDDSNCDCRRRTVASHAANDGEAETWFTHIHRSQKQIHEECKSKRRRLNNLAHRWEHYLSLYDKLAVQHAHRALETYRHAQATETALQHVRELRAVYTKTLTAKQDYHLLVTNLLKEHIETQHRKNAYTVLCLERRQWYEQAKHYTMLQHANGKTSLLSHERFARLCTDTTLLLTDHNRHARYALLQQGRITQLAQDTAKAYRLKAASPLLGRIQTGATDHILRTETDTGAVGPHLVGSSAAATTKTTKSAVGSKRVGNPSNMTTPTPTGNHGGPVKS